MEVRLRNGKDRRGGGECRIESKKKRVSGIMDNPISVSEQMDMSETERILSRSADDIKLGGTAHTT